MDTELVQKNPLFDISKIPTGYKRIPALNGIYQDAENEIDITKAEITVSQRKDIEKFVKIYPETFTEIINLSKSTQRLLNAFIQTYIKTQKSYKDDRLYFNKKQAIKYSKYNDTNNYYYKSLKELKNKQFIMRTDDNNIWFLNPHKFFIGNRLLIGK